MTSVWVADHGWCYLKATVGLLPREVAGFGLDLRRCHQEAEVVVDAVRSRRDGPMERPEVGGNLPGVDLDKLRGDSIASRAHVLAANGFTAEELGQGRSVRNAGEDVR